jgi:hypothetical protein
VFGTPAGGSAVLALAHLFVLRAEGATVEERRFIGGPRPGPLLAGWGGSAAKRVRGNSNLAAAGLRAAKRSGNLRSAIEPLKRKGHPFDSLQSPSTAVKDSHHSTSTTDALRTPGFGLRRHKPAFSNQPSAFSPTEDAAEASTAATGKRGCWRSRLRSTCALGTPRVLQHASRKLQV